MKFGDMPYERVLYETVEARCLALTEELRRAGSAAECMKILEKRSALTEDMTPMDLCFVRHDIDVNDAFYAAEQEYYDTVGPKLTELSNRFDRALLASPWRKELEELLGKQPLALMEAGQTSFDERLIPLMQEENSLMGRYTQITAKATALWEGGQVKCSRLAPQLHSRDRGTRRRAADAVSDAWEKDRPELEDLFARLVQNRSRQAEALGFSSYTELSYPLMCRIGYGPEEVRSFREAVKKELSPLYSDLQEVRRRRLGLERLYAYDNGCFFREGNPKPPEDSARCLELTRAMYCEMSPETAEYITYMLDNELMDVEIRDGKRGGGYMTYFAKYQAPFIFANFDGTIENAYIMCHEGGHAFQGYLKRGEKLQEWRGTTPEAAETHAMAMEFFAYPYMELFFGERASDYRTMHSEDAVRLIISECLQDEFQQRIYDEPEMKPEDRNALWNALNRAYFPYQTPSDHQNVIDGCGWQRIPHMYQWPFYAVDYALAQMCAFAYYKWMEEAPGEAWKSYLAFCRDTGKKSFPELVRDAQLPDPFREETVRALAGWLRGKLIGDDAGQVKCSG